MKFRDKFLYWRAEASKTPSARPIRVTAPFHDSVDVMAWLTVEEAEVLAGELAAAIDRVRMGDDKGAA